MGDDKEPAATVELGGAASQGLTGGGSSFGPTLAVEVTPIENRLELEAGITALFKRHSTEWSADLLFKKPWALSKKAEFMVGIGPEWIRARQYSTITNSLAAEAAAILRTCLGIFEELPDRWGLLVSSGSGALSGL